ncbi:MAG: hypothetical protein JWS12_341 [Candidatus Saccharibacteria bacterium]|nr:hypothetical protein [Candidatus Saccharibacteria bacterium]
MLKLRQSTQKMKKKSSITKRFISVHRLSILAVVAVLAMTGLGARFARADQFDEQIKALNQQNAQSAQAKAQLGVEASSLSDEIAKLQAQINTLENQIQANQNKRDDIQRQITAAEEELAKQKRVLGEDIKQMYLDGQISTLEMLASSKDLSEFIDKQQYRSAVQQKIKETLDKITELKHQLAAQKIEVEKLLKDEQAMQATLDGQRAQNANLLALNQNQQSSLDQQIKTNFAQITSLRRQQATENAKLFKGARVVSGGACDTAHGDTYPAQWCAIPQDSVIDAWGMYNRECVSYTAWKVYESGRHMPYWGGVGNANQWDDDARAAGIPVDGNPRAGDVAIKNSLPYGHAMYVESVNADGSLNISQYNQQLDGRYSLAYNVSASGLVFIHFP